MCTLTFYLMVALLLDYSDLGPYLVHTVQNALPTF